MIVRGSNHFYTQYDVRLVEEAVLLRIAGHPEEVRFRRLRNRVYEVTEAEEREKRFDRLHSAWFRRLGLGRPVESVFDEQPLLLREARFCCVVAAVSSRDESADLHNLRSSQSESRMSADKMILVKVKPSTLLDSSKVQTLFRHELMHIADMLDPDFGYEPFLPNSEAGPVCDNLIRERYRVLWDASIDGRLERQGRATKDVREKRLAEFMRTFSMCGPSGQEAFLRFFESSSQTHRDLIAFAEDPDGRIEPCGAAAASPGTQRCPLCHFPGPNSATATNLADWVVEEIAVDFPHWRPEHGLCGQCADLYRAREISRCAAAALPRT